jgi:hypothetical protein
MDCRQGSELYSLILFIKRKEMAEVAQPLCSLCGAHAVALYVDMTNDALYVDMMEFVQWHRLAGEVPSSSAWDAKALSRDAVGINYQPPTIVPGGDLVKEVSLIDPITHAAIIIGTLLV